MLNFKFRHISIFDEERYQSQSKIGEGSYGVVNRAWDSEKKKVTIYKVHKVVGRSEETEVQ
jgi:serine/threonine protein kinase